MRTIANTNQYSGQEILAIISGWQPTPYPVHRSLEVEAMEMVDIAERDYASRSTYARRGVK